MTENKYCTRCGARSHTVEQCRAKRHVKTRALLESPTNPTVYVLQLEHDCYYVGCTYSLETRIHQHENGLGSEWTRLHKPLHTVACFTNYSNYAGSQYSSQERDEFMANVYNRGGLQHVRGWLYSNDYISDADQKHIEREVCAHFGLCYNCGHGSHLKDKCYATIRAKWCYGERYYQERDMFTA
jgi:hypothetical protein